jgi:virginiamycin A acetyltransferase
MNKILSILRNLILLLAKTKSQNAFSNMLVGNIKLPNKITYFKGNNISGDVTLKEGISLFNVFIGGDVEIGRYTSVNGPNTFLVSKNGKIKIGNFCSIARNVQIQGVYHNYNRVTTSSIFKSFFKEHDSDEFICKGDIIIEHDVWIGANSVILSGIKIGRGSVIAAGSIVTKNVEPYSVVAGNPAKKIRSRFSDDIINELEKSEWWLWDDETILKNRHFFKRDLNLL